MSGMSCYAPRIAGLFALTGSFWLGDYSQQFADRYDNPEWKAPETIIVWGNNPIVSNSDGLYGHWAVDCMMRGRKLIVVDPRATWLASRAEIYLPVRPGTDGALALAMLNVIIEEGLYDHDFVERWTFGFDELAEVAEEYTPEFGEEITWVPADDIVAAARMWANGESGIIQWGVAVDMTVETMPTAQAISTLGQVCGFVDKPGCMVPPVELLNYAGGWGEELLPPEQYDKRIGIKEYPLLKFGFKLCSTDMLIEVMETDDPYPLKAAWLQTTNTLVNPSPGPERALNAFRRMEFIVAVDIFMTPTAMALADVFLPVTMFPERNGIRLVEVTPIVGDGVINTDHAWWYPEAPAEMEDGLRAAFRAETAEEAGRLLAAWLHDAACCKIRPVVEVEKKVRRRRADAGAVELGVSSGRVEAVNNKVEAIMKMGCGFRNTDNLIALTMLRCSDMKPELPGRPPRKKKGKKARKQALPRPDVPHLRDGDDRHGRWARAHRRHRRDPKPFPRHRLHHRPCAGTPVGGHD